MDLRDSDKHTEGGLRLLGYLILFIGVIGCLYYITNAPSGSGLFDRAIREMAIVYGLAILLGSIFWSWMIFKFVGLIETAKDTQFMVAASYVRPAVAVREEPILEAHVLQVPEPTPVEPSAPARTRDELIAKARRERAEREGRERALDQQYKRVEP